MVGGDCGRAGEGLPVGGVPEGEVRGFHFIVIDPTALRMPSDLQVFPVPPQDLRPIPRRRFDRLPGAALVPVPRGILLLRRHLREAGRRPLCVTVAANDMGNAALKVCANA